MVVHGFVLFLYLLDALFFELFLGQDLLIVSVLGLPSLVDLLDQVLGFKGLGVVHGVVVCVDQVICVDVELVLVGEILFLKSTP